MSKRIPATLVSTALSKWNDYSRRDFLLNIGRWNIPSHLHNDLESQLDRDRLSLLPWWGERESPWVSIEERLALAAKRNDLEEVASLLLQLHAIHRSVARLLDENPQYEHRPLPSFASLLLKPLNVAAGNNHLALIQLLFGLGASPPTSFAREGPLEAAAQAGHLEVVRLLLTTFGTEQTHTAQGSHLEVLFSATYVTRVRLAIMKAVESGQLTTVQVLLESVPDYSVGLALPSAIKSGHPEIVHLLLEHGAKLTWMEDYQHVLSNRLILDDLLRHDAANPEKPVLDLRELLAAAIAKGDHDLVQRLIDHHGVDINDPTIPDKVMKEVAVTGNIEVFHELLDGGFQPSTSTLEMAAANGHLAMVRELGKGSALVIVAAAENGHLAIVQELIDSINDLRPVLAGAAGHGHSEIVQWLLENRAQSLTDEMLLTAIESANYRNHHQAIAEQLVQLITDRRVKNDALVNFSRSGNLETVRWLLANGVTASAEALDAATWYGHGEVIKLLVDNGAEILHQTIIRAVSNGHLTLALLLLEHELAYHERGQPTNGDEPNSR